MTYKIRRAVDPRFLGWRRKSSRKNLGWVGGMGTGGGSGNRAHRSFVHHRFFSDYQEGDHRVGLDRSVAKRGRPGPRFGRNSGFPVGFAISRYLSVRN